MKILGVNTSTHSGSVALLEDWEVVDEIASPESRSFSRYLLTMLDELLSRSRVKPSKIDGFGITLGPGSFTGIRIGLATLIGIAYSQKKPVFGVSTLEAMARAAVSAGTGKGGQYFPLLDAGKGNVYSAGFIGSNSNLERIREDRAQTIEDLLKESGRDALFFGEGAETYRDRLESGGACLLDEVPEISIAAGAAKAGYAAMIRGESGDISLLRSNYIHRGPVNKK